MVRQMWRISFPQEQRIANVDGVRLFDGRLPGTSLYSGPFENAADFHRHLRSNVELDKRNKPEINTGKNEFQ
jgi:hypothetical protein